MCMHAAPFAQAAGICATARTNGASHMCLPPPLYVKLHARTRSLLLQPFSERAGAWNWAAAWELGILIYYMNAVFCLNKLHLTMHIQKF